MELILMRAYVYVNINMVENNVDINDVDDNNDNHKELNKGEWTETKMFFLENCLYSEKLNEAIW